MSERRDVSARAGMEEASERAVSAQAQQAAGPLLTTSAA